jgi:hypothetical protein
MVRKALSGLLSQFKMLIDCAASAGTILSKCTKSREPSELLVLVVSVVLEQANWLLADSG